jgi:malonyl-CoA O-methyltransferase
MFIFLPLAVVKIYMKQETIQVFNQAQVRGAFDRAADRYEQFAVLQNEVCHRLLEKLEIVTIKPTFILDAGAGTGKAIPALFDRYKKAQVVALDLSENMLEKSSRHGGFFRSPHLVCADIEKLPFADDSFDLVFSSLSMQWCNDLGAALLEAKRVLKPGGLFVFSTFGPDTLKELRHSWAQVDEANHVNHFIDMHDIGDALLQGGYAEPVMEAEIMTVTYDSVDAIMHDLKAIGANITASTSSQVTSKKGLMGKSALQTVRRSYESFRRDDVLPATYEIIYGHAWKAENAAMKPQGANYQTVDFTS